MENVKLTKNKMVINTARIINEIYKQSKFVKDWDLEATLFRLHRRKYYNGLYEYGLNNGEIDNIIEKSSLFALCMSLTDYSRQRYYQSYNYSVPRNHEKELFDYASKLVAELKEDSEFNAYKEQLQDEHTLKLTQDVFNYISYELNDTHENEEGLKK